MDELIQQSFDYGTIDQDTKGFLLECEEEIDFILQRSGHRIGQILIKVKERLPHGEFGKWIEAKWGWSDRTCQELMNIARNFKSAQSADLFPRKIQSILAAPSTPETARTEAIEKSENGESLSIKEAKRIIAEHKAKIAELESRPAQVQTQIVYQDKVPDDYPTLISERDTLVDEKGRLLSQIKKLKTTQEADVEQKVNQKFRALDDEFNLKNAQLKAVQDRIDYLRESMKQMDKTAGDIVACKKACDQVRGFLLDISIALRDLFEDHKLTESAEREMRHLCGELEQGAAAFRKYLDGEAFVQIGEE